MSILGTSTASTAANGSGASIQNLLTVPNEILQPWLGKVQYGSVLAALSAQTPMRFGTGQAMTFDIGEAEYVGEGQAKGPSAFTTTSMTVEPKKFHKTLRFTEEVLWADEETQLSVVQDILDQIQPSLSRALDFAGIHGINPADGAVNAAFTQTVNDSTNVVETDDIPPVAPYTYVDAADALVLAAGYVPRDLALDPAFAARFSSYRNPTTFQKFYPDLRLSTEVSEVEGHRASVSRTVGAVGTADVATNILGIVGDFSAFRWGVQKAIGLELIRYGDPDGQGDLKRYNQVAFRAEVVYGWGIADLNAFALIKNAVVDA